MYGLFQFERHALKINRAAGHHFFPGSSRASETNFMDIGMLGHMLTQLISPLTTFQYLPVIHGQ